MSQRHEAHISVWEDYSWRGTSHTNPLPLYVDSESFTVNKNIRDLQNLARDGRVGRVESQVGANSAPEGNLTFQPRSDDCASVLFSHFQTGTSIDNGDSYKYIFFPSKNNPSYDKGCLRSLGTYGGVPGGVYSVSFLKKYFDTTENGGTNSIFFEHGICDKLSFNINAGADFVLGCDYKFRDVIVGTKVAGNPSDSGYGSYSGNAPWEWFEGTVLVEDTALNLNSLSWVCDNNNTPKFVAGRQDAEWFAFGDHVTKGVFDLDFPRDGMLQIGSMIGTKSFSIVGTLFKSGTESLAFSMPNCIRKPFDVSLNSNVVTAGIPFIALEKDGVSPVTITLASGAELNFFDDIFWDAGTTFYNSSRTLGDYEIVDGGTSFYNVSRTLGDYGIADRDL